MDRQTTIAENEALRRALNDALDIVDAERSKATNARVETERAVANADHWRRQYLAAKRPARIGEYAVAAALGAIVTALTILNMGAWL